MKRFDRNNQVDNRDILSILQYDFLLPRNSKRLYVLITENERWFMYDGT